MEKLRGPVSPAARFNGIARALGISPKHLHGFQRKKFQIFTNLHSLGQDVPRYGNDVAADRIGLEDIQEFAGIRLGPGTLYGAITRLEERGWIRPLGSDSRRRPYRLTAEGRRYLQHELAGLSQVVKTGLRRLENA